MDLSLLGFHLPVFFVCLSTRHLYSRTQEGAGEGKGGVAGKSQPGKTHGSVEFMDKGCVGGCGRVLGVTLGACMAEPVTAVWINRLLKAQSYQLAWLQG